MAGVHFNEGRGQGKCMGNQCAKTRAQAMAGGDMFDCLMAYIPHQTLMTHHHHSCNCCLFFPFYTNYVDSLTILSPGWLILFSEPALTADPHAITIRSLLCVHFANFGTVPRHNIQIDGWGVTKFSTIIQTLVVITSHPLEIRMTIIFIL